MAALARAGSVVALLVVLVLALVPTWTGPGAGPVLAPGPSAVQAASANPGVAPADALSAHVSADRSAADAGQSITFACSASGGTPPYVYAWTLSDGGIGTGPTITHSFGSPGTYRRRAAMRPRASPSQHRPAEAAARRIRFRGRSGTGPRGPVLPLRTPTPPEAAIRPRSRRPIRWEAPRSPRRRP